MGRWPTRGDGAVIRSAFGPEHPNKCPALPFFEVFAALSDTFGGRTRPTTDSFTHPQQPRPFAPYQLTCQGVPLTLCSAAYPLLLWIQAAKRAEAASGALAASANTRIAPDASPAFLTPS